MKGLFVEWSIAMVFAIVLCFGGTMYIVRDSIESHRSEVMPPLGHLPAVQLWEMTDGLPPDQLPTAVEEYGKKLDAPVALVTADDSIPDTVLNRVEAGEVGWSSGRGGVSLYIPVHDSDQIVVLGPVEGFFDPHPKDVTKAIAMMLAVVAVLSTIPLIPTVRRVRRLQRAARAIGEGSLDARVPEGSPNALGKLERHFNTMAGKVEELLSSQRQLVQAVAHEIRTPIARIQFGLEMVELAEDPAEKERRQADLHEELEELDQLVGELLVFSRYDVGTAELDCVDVDVADVVKARVQRDTERFEEIDVRVDGLDEVGEVHVHARSFDRVVHNLVSNALRHADARVVVEATRAGEGALVLTVDDDGAGIPEADRERILEPFARVDGSRDRATGGVGLGLAIVRRIVEAHGGEIHVETSPLGGARFVTSWPAV